jgi:ribonuclease BN (tRNA processing enzyme)
MALDAGVKRLGLFHLNQERPDSQVDRMVDECRQILSQSKPAAVMDCFAVASGMEFTL